MSHHGYFYGGPEGTVARDAGRQASAAASAARKVRSESEALVDRVERLALMTEALWILLRDRFDVQEEELLKIARDLDLSDGKLDGRVQRAASECPGCRRMVGKRHAKCLYCGTEMPRAPFTGA